MKMTTFSVLMLLVCVGWTAAQDEPLLPTRVPGPAAMEEGLARSADKVRREEGIPRGCTVSMRETNTDYGSVSCNAKMATHAKYDATLKSWAWQDGNCYCPAYRWLTCPKTIRVGNRDLQVVNWGNGAQCWSEAKCGLRGLCPTRCVPQYSYRSVLVINNSRLQWVYYRYVSGCRCTTCNGGYCWGNLNGVTLLG